MRQAWLGLAILACVPLTLATGSVPPPTNVAAVSADPVTTVISWLPPVSTDQPATYNVYGIGSGGAVKLVTTNGTVATVAAGFAEYAVTTVYDTVESTMARTGQACLETDLTPPPPQVGFNPTCGAGSGGGGAQPGDLYVRVTLP